MVDSIIKETDLDPCIKQTLEELGEFGLFDLSRVYSSQAMVLCIFFLFFPRGPLNLGTGVYEGTSR